MTILSVFGIADAIAGTAATTTGAAVGAAHTPATTGQGFLSMLPLLLILVAFMYFMVIRPQSKRVKEHRNLVTSLKVGDEVVTAGGILGRIEKMDENFISLNIAENTIIRVQKNSVVSGVPKGTIKAS
jgi:preprotein translocase subunit YajC